MKRIVVVLLSTLAGSALLAQSPAKPAKKVTSRAVSPAPESGQEMNIREYIELLTSRSRRRRSWATSCSLTLLKLLSN
jgi:hypothetical protein